jgi:tRNA A-37 threonylcarbamoyl transferase component Bud32
MIGASILNYEIISLIGEGGMGNVYLAEDKAIGRKVAVKAILPHLAKNDHVRDRFMNELKTMSRLNHDNIVKMHEYVANEHGLYLIMEYVDGMPLDDYIQKLGKPIEEDLAIEITKQIVSACSHAHSKGVVHRDIKPGNVMITKDNKVKILDFGIAKIVNEEVNKLTKTGLQVGTVYYMAPEQVQGHPITFQTDIYSIGVTLYQMVTIENPYKEFNTEFQIYKKIIEEPLSNVQKKNPDLSVFIDKVIQKATRKKPEDRFADCEQFLKVLEDKESYMKKYEAKEISNSTSTDSRTTSTKQNSNINTTSLVLGLASAVLGVLFSFIAFNVCGIALLGILLGGYALFIGIKFKRRAEYDKEYEAHRNLANGTWIVGVFALLLCVVALLACTMKDSDNDGFYDRNDNCPNEFGVVDGCPDYDGDGIIDNLDDCPYSAGGDLFGQGCPDSDLDGIYDDVDECDNEYGPAENNGCPWPDSDNDGVPNKDDICPYDYGPIANNGCPYKDSDNDGVLDKDDACPNKYGPSSNNGCPDPKGRVVFWQSTWDRLPTTTVTINGIRKKITKDRSYAPNCGDRGCATFSLSPGSYSFSARSISGDYWSGTISIYENDCQTMQLQK